MTCCQIESMNSFIHDSLFFTVHCNELLSEITRLKKCDSYLVVLCIAFRFHNSIHNLFMVWGRSAGAGKRIVETSRS
jgi:hypothetical protein